MEHTAVMVPYDALIDRLARSLLEEAGVAEHNVIATLRNSTRDAKIDFIIFWSTR